MIFSHLKDKQKKAYRLKNYDDILIQSILPMLEYSNMPDSIVPNLFERERILNGVTAVWKMDDKIISTPVTFGGTPDIYGRGTTAICITYNGISKTFEDCFNNDNIAFVYLNSNYSPDLTIGIYADILAEIDTSIIANLINSRFANIPVVDDEKQKIAVENAFNKIISGQPSVIVQKNILSDLVNENGIKMLSMTNVKDSDKIQYLTKCHDDIFRWFYSLHGLNSQGSSKMAQQTSDEILTDNIASMIIPFDILNTAKIGIDEVNRKFGTNISVDFSEAWKMRLTEFTAENNVENSVENVENVENVEKGDNNDTDIKSDNNAENN